MRRNKFSFLTIGSLALLLSTTTPAVLAQMHPGAPMGGAPNNMNSPSGNMSPDEMRRNGMMGSQNADQMIEQRMFGNLRRNFDVENDLSKMALKNSSNDDVKKFAQQVISENHGLSNDLVIPNPTGEMMQPEMVPEQTKRAKKQMKKMTGKPFDQMYLVQMNAYVRNDQDVAQKAQTASNLPRVSEVGMRVRSLSEERAKQIGTLTQGEGFKIQ